jgi:hypothetical protein
MKISPQWILGLVGTAILTVLGFIGATVWDGVQIAERTAVRVEAIEKAQDRIEMIQEKIRDNQREIQSDLYRLYGAVSDVATEADVALEVQ